MARTVEIDSDIFIDMLWDRVNEMDSYDSYSEKFWKECFEYLDEIGFLKPKFNKPSYIVDNIMINAEITPKDECADNYDDINEQFDGDVEAWAEEHGYFIWDDFVVINLGL